MWAISRSVASTWNALQILSQTIEHSPSPAPSSKTLLSRKRKEFLVRYLESRTLPSHRLRLVAEFGLSGKLFPVLGLGFSKMMIFCWANFKVVVVEPASVVQKRLYWIWRGGVEDVVETAIVNFKFFCLRIWFAQRDWMLVAFVADMIWPLTNARRAMSVSSRSTSRRSLKGSTSFENEMQKIRLAIIGNGGSRLVVHYQTGGGKFTFNW